MSALNGNVKDFEQAIIMWITTSMNVNGSDFKKVGTSPKEFHFSESKTIWDFPTLYKTKFEPQIVLSNTEEKACQTVFKDAQSLSMKKRPPPNESTQDEISGFVSANELMVNFLLFLKDCKEKQLEIKGSNLRRLVNKKSKFISPLLKPKDTPPDNGNKGLSLENGTSKNLDPNYKNLDPNLVQMIENEIMELQSQIHWDDIAGLEKVKKNLIEIVVWPMLRPDLFQGLRGPPKGLLLFGPPGTGKTLIGKCIASQCHATFFSISSSSLTSKWIGEGEKMVRTLFAVARMKQPSVIFIDEIDSLLSQRLDGEQEATRRIKTEFLIQFDGCTTDSNDRILVIGATNRPHEIDEAARRRFRKRLYIPLPEDSGRCQIIHHLLKKQSHSLSIKDIEFIVTKTDGYSGSDMDGLIREAAIGPLRDVKDIENISVADLRPIQIGDFENALRQVRASVSLKDLELYEKFENSFGSKNS